MLVKKYGELLTGVGFLILSAIVYLGALALPPSLLGGIGANFMPKILAAATCILSLMQIYVGVVALKHYKDGGGAVKSDLWRVWATIVIFTVYVCTLESVGFLVGSIVYLFLQITVLAPKEKRRPVLFAVISVITCCLVYFIFRFGLSVMLPVGILG